MLSVSAEWFSYAGERFEFLSLGEGGKSKAVRTRADSQKLARADPWDPKAIVVGTLRKVSLEVEPWISPHPLWGPFSPAQDGLPMAHFLCTASPFDGATGPASQQVRIRCKWPG